MKEQTVGSTPRIVFEQKPNEVIFVAEYLKKARFVNCYWPIGKSFKDFKKLIENEGIELEWKDRDGVQRGMSGDCNFWWDPMYEGRVPRAGFQINVMSRSDIGNLLEKAVKIASETVQERVSFPSSLTNELKKFVATSLEEQHK